MREVYSCLSVTASCTGQPESHGHSKVMYDRDDFVELRKVDAQQSPMVAQQSPMVITKDCEPSSLSAETMPRYYKMMRIDSHIQRFASTHSNVPHGDNCVGMINSSSTIEQ